MRPEPDAAEPDAADMTAADTTGTGGLRFGHQLRATTIGEAVAEARQAEAAGFDVVSVPDHVGATLASPLILLTAIAAATSSIRLGTLVLNNEMRNPVQLAWEVATLDRISGGRFELGLGAGHTPQEFAATGVPHRPPAERKARLAETVEVLGPLLSGRTVDHVGAHLHLAEARVGAAVQEPVPILVGGSGRSLLTHAGRHADIVGLTGLGRTLADGHRHRVRWSPAHLEGQLATVAAGAAGRAAGPELNVLVQRVVVTDDRERHLTELAAGIEGLDPADALTTPFLAYGTVDELADQFQRAHRDWGIGYHVTRDVEAMAPVLARLRSRSS